MGTLKTFLVAVTFLLVSGPLGAHATFTFTIIEVPVPDAPHTLPFGINNRGQIVGYFEEEGGAVHGFLDTGGVFTLPIDVPGAAYTVTAGINDKGQIVGWGVIPGVQGFHYTGGVFIPINPPGSNYTIVTGINNSGEIVGYFSDPTVGAFRGFLDTGGVFTTINVPGAYYTNASGINDRGQIVGVYSPADATGQHGLGEHGFLDTDGVFTTIDVPGATHTYAYGINNRGQIVGFYFDATGQQRGFLDTGGVFTTIDVPGASTVANGINDRGEIVGYFSDASGVHGFLAAVPAPSSLLLLGTGLAFGALWRRIPRRSVGRSSVAGVDRDSPRSRACRACAKSMTLAALRSVVVIVSSSSVPSGLGRATAPAGRAGPARTARAFPRITP